MAKAVHGPGALAAGDVPAHEEENPPLESDTNSSSHNIDEPTVLVQDASPPTLTLSTPPILLLGDDFVEFTMAVENPADEGVDFERVRFDFSLDGPAGLAASHVALEYWDENGLQWRPLSLAGDNGSISGHFGPANGFPMPAGFTADTRFRVRVIRDAPTGTLDGTVSLVMVDESGSVLDELTRAGFTVTLAPLLHVNHQWEGTPNGTDPDGDGPAGEFGTYSFATIQQAVNKARQSG